MFSLHGVVQLWSVSVSYCLDFSHRFPALISYLIITLHHATPAAFVLFVSHMISHQHFLFHTFIRPSPIITALICLPRDHYWAERDSFLDQFVGLRSSSPLSVLRSVSLFEPFLSVSTDFGACLRKGENSLRREPSHRVLSRKRALI